MRINRLILTAYGRCRDVAVDIGDGVTVVLGANEAGKSTSLDALSDFLWGIPKNTPRASEFTRSRLRVDGVLVGEHGLRTVVRKSTGLFADDLATELPAPWNPENRLTAGWWCTRLGINHADLRRVGSEVFAGSGDLADIIFAAREGHSAREVLREITEKADKIFKPDRRAKKAQLRLAVADYQRAVDDRDRRLTRAGAIVEQRAALRELEARHRQLRSEATATGRALTLAEENRRVIGSVLTLSQATREREAIDAEGPRLSPSELSDYDKAGDDSRNASGRTAKLDDEIDSKTRAIDDLSVDDGLLDDRTTFNRLQPDVKVRIEDLRRAGEEFGAAVDEAEIRLRELLGSIGIEATGDLDAAVAGARVRDDHAATLDGLADRRDGLEQMRQDARDGCDRALGGLLTKGIAVEISASTPPDEGAIDKLRAALIGARQEEVKAETLLAEATSAARVLQSRASEPPAGAAITRDAVVEARAIRDAQWSTIRRSWVSGELPDTADRIDMAAEFDTSLADSDRIADDEAVERSCVAALDARAAVQVEGLDAAREKQREARTSLEAAAEDYRRAQNDWSAAWTALGIVRIPDVDNSSVVAGLLSTAHVEHAGERSAAEQIAELDGWWCVATELAGLSTFTTTAAWRERARVLNEIEAVDAERVKDRKREATARGNWAEFSAEAVELLHRHQVIGDGRQATPAAIEQGFAKLGRRLDAAAEAAAKREGYLEQIEEKRAERDEVLRAQHDAVVALQRLVEVHAVATEQELAVLADRAGRVAEPLAQQQEATKAIKNGLNPGSDLRDVIDRLAGHDTVTVAQAVDDAHLCDQQARDAAEELLSQCTSARDHLRELEESAGAADAEAFVVSKQAEVAQLTETWAILTLQRKLLEAVLGELGTDDTRPLLDHAGRLLEQLTDGRWVALRADDDGTTRKLRVIRADNTPCDTGQLSEGTADQVFFALRLAAVAELHTERAEAGEATLPLVLDDVLVAFDDARVRHALEILVSLAPGLQIIVFTHHRHVADAAATIGGITVSQLPEAAAITEGLDSELVRAQR